jgi:FKBP-type peptidyl-prolyl cis-trans isomerase FklB
MKKILVLACALITLNATAQKTKTPVAAKKPVPKPVVQPAAPKPVVLKNITDSASYAMGISLASFYAQQGIKNINPDLVARAIRDVMGGKPTPITDAEVNDVVMKMMHGIQLEKVKSTIAEGQKFLAENKKRPGVKTTSSGLQYEVLRAGTGALPTANDEVTVHYAGTLLDGTEFDNSIKRGQPATFGVGAVIKGWTEALQLMPAGSKYKLWIPYNLGYDVFGQGQIPGGATLVFEVELLEIKSK